MFSLWYLFVFTTFETVAVRHYGIGVPVWGAPLPPQSRNRRPKNLANSCLSILPASSVMISTTRASMPRTSSDILTPASSHMWVSWFAVNGSSRTESLSRASIVCYCPKYTTYRGICLGDFGFFEKSAVRVDLGGGEVCRGETDKISPPYPSERVRGGGLPR